VSGISRLGASGMVRQSLPFDEEHCSLIAADNYTTSQLILISHDRLAQYWETFGHVSFYQRVDIDAFTRV
jgi:hypothetical protein